jgi:hypothetical protein
MEPKPITVRLSSVRCIAQVTSSRQCAVRLLCQGEADMTNMEIKALEHAGRTAMAWTEGYDGESHFADVLKALAPALFILVAATALMLALL